MKTEMSRPQRSAFIAAFIVAFVAAFVATDTTIFFIFKLGQLTSIFADLEKQKKKGG